MGWESGVKTWLKDKTFSLLFCLCSSQSYCLCIFSSCQLKDNYVVFSNIMALTWDRRRLNLTQFESVVQIHLLSFFFLFLKFLYSFGKVPWQKSTCGGFITLLVLFCFSILLTSHFAINLSEHSPPLYNWLHMICEVDGASESKCNVTHHQSTATLFSFLSFHAALLHACHMSKSNWALLCLVPFFSSFSPFSFSTPAAIFSLFLHRNLFFKQGKQIKYCIMSDIQCCFFVLIMDLFISVKNK